MLKRYEELTDYQKEQARELRPDDYTEWYYRTIGVDIEFAAR